MATASPALTGSPVKPTHKSNAGSLADPYIRRHADVVRSLMEREMRGQWIGPMSVDSFLETFMPVNEEVKKSCPKIPKNFFEPVSSKKKEVDMYEEWLKIMKDKKAKFLPNFKLVDTSNKQDKCGDQQWHIDLTCYSDQVEVGENPNQLDKAEWGIEFKAHDGDDPFGPASRFVDYELHSTNGKRAKKTRGQLATYAAEWFNHQHRTHIFTIFISKTTARFLYFDRSGAVVSDRFKYHEDATPIVKFMWYFTQLSEAQRGIDTTVEIAEPSQAEIYLAKLEQFHRRVATLEVYPKAIDSLKKQKAQKHPGQPVSDVVLTDADWDSLWDEVDSEGSIAKLLTGDDLAQIETLVEERMPSSTRAVVAIKVPDVAGTRLVISKGFASSAESLSGRSTRAWPVWDPKDNKLYYLKDMWRSLLEGIEPETDILKVLNEGQVNHVPRLICGGDILDHKTRIAEFTGAPHEHHKRESWVYGEVAITPRIHHRFLVDFIGRPIKHFNHSKQMLQAVYDAFNAHREAWKNCDILHRDISANNVMLDRWGRGVLNDWDMAKKVQKGETERPRTHARTGTWYFMSTMLLQQPGKAHTVYDDWESFVLLVLYLALSFLDHSHLDSLGEFMYKFFEECEVHPFKKTFVGGDMKLKEFRKGGAGGRDFISTFKVTANKPLEMWFSSVLGELAKWIGWLVTLQEVCGGEKELIMMEPVKKLRGVKFDDEDFLPSMFQKALDDPDWPEYPDKTFNDVSRPTDYHKVTTSVTTGSKRTFDGASSSSSSDDDRDLKKQKL